MTQAITAPESDKPFKVEQRGIDIVPESERHGSPLELFWIWAAGHSGRGGGAWHGRSGRQDRTGKKADIVLASPEHLDMQPVYDPVFTAARGITGRDVDSVIVDGKLVVEHGTLTTLDEPGLRGRLAERWPVIMARFESAVSAR